MKIVSERLLDAKLQPCFEDVAALKETIIEEETQQEISTTQEIRVYPEESDELITEGTRSRRTDLPPFSISAGEEFGMGGRTFICDHTGSWVWENAAMRIEVEINSDMKDVLKVLACVDWVDEPVLARGLASGKPVFKIGFKCRNGGTGELVVVSPSKNRIDFPPLPCGRIAAAAAYEAVGKTERPLSLQALVCGSVCRLLPPFFREDWILLKAALEQEIPSLDSALLEISPGYLCPRFSELKRRFPGLGKDRTRGGASAVVEGAEISVATLSDNLVSEFARDLLLEMIRFYYLQPAITGEFPTTTLTRNDVLDGIQSRLVYEAKHSRGSTKYRNVFPRVKTQDSQNIDV